MEFYILLLVIIAVLLIYIVYLHLQLSKKNLFIDTTIRRLYGSEMKWTHEELMGFLQELRKVEHYRVLFNDKLFADEPLKFLLENETDIRIFIHYTREEYVAKNIIQNGFLFADSFYKTALPVTQDRLDLLMKHNTRKSFGDYLMIIGLGIKIADYYSAEIEKRGLKGVALENVLTEEPPERNDNGDLVFRLPKYYIKGYINHQTGEIVKNPAFNPNFDSSSFVNNLDAFKSKQLAG